MSDEFKNSGRYFAEGEYVSLPITIPNTDWTIEGWFIWLEGNGPLIEAENGDWHIAQEVDGRCGYRIGGVDRIAPIETAAMHETWIYLVVAKEGAAAILYFNGEPLDEWDAAPAGATLSTCAAMKSAVGFAADVAVYERKLNGNEIGLHWELGKARV